MMIYIAAGSRIANAECRDLGCGILISPDNQRDVSAHRFALDNGAFPAWLHGRPWDEEKFYATVSSLAAEGHIPDFVVVPDQVAGGLASLEVSLSHVARFPAGWPRYLAVQDGMTPADVRPYLDRFEGIFIGGTVTWKWRTAPDWITFAHAAGIPAHIGQVGTVRNYLRAYALGADSVDGSSPMRHQDLGRVERFRATLREQSSIDHRWGNLAAGITGDGAL